jgi:hypothetical protein
MNKNSLEKKVSGSSTTVLYEKPFQEANEKKVEKEKPKIIFKELKVKEEEKKKTVHWTEDTVYNEGLNLKKSKSEFFV